LGQKYQKRIISGKGKALSIYNHGKKEKKKKEKSIKKKTN
jgi:hypothetical protein